MSGQPDPKPVKPHKADVDEWLILRRLKLGSCRVCEKSPSGIWGIQLHHLVGRDLGGEDLPANLVPLCPLCHQRVEERSRVSCELLRASLTAVELEYIVKHKGWDFLARYYPQANAEDVQPTASAEISV